MADSFSIGTYGWSTPATIGVYGWTETVTVTVEAPTTVKATVYLDAHILAKTEMAEKIIADVKLQPSFVQPTQLTATQVVEATVESLMSHQVELATRLAKEVTV